MLADGARPRRPSRTATPLELDQIYQSLDDLTVALGPDGANKKGALTRPARLDRRATSSGQGEKFHQTIEDLSRLTTTLDDNKEELFGTAREIERFVDALAEERRAPCAGSTTRSPSAADLLADERERPGRRAAQPRRSR